MTSTAGASSTPGAPALELRGLSKRYVGAEVLHSVDLTVRAGSVHGLVGPNGAGKSTLVRILAGLTRPDDGSFVVRPREEGQEATIGFVQQDLGLVGDLTVRENLQLGAPALRRLGLVDHRRERRWAAEHLRSVGLDVGPETPLRTLGLGQQTLLAVARLFARDHDVIVLDEATAALSRRDGDGVMRRVRTFADRGGSAVVVSHRLDEISRHCSTVTVLRDGRVAYDGETPTVHDLHRLLAGDRRRHIPPRPRPAAPAPLLRLAGACGDGIGPIDLELSSGEVTVLLGALSSNLYAVAHLAAGRLRLDSGVRQLIPPADGARIGFLPEERRSQGVFPHLEVASNVSISSLRRTRRRGLVSARRERQLVSGPIEELGITPADPDVLVATLSGGNQQKALLGRALLAEPAVYVLCEPTRGVDVATRDAVFAFVDRVREAGAAVLVVTVDMDDAFAVADRIGLVVDRRVVDVLPRDAVTPESLEDRLA